MKRPTVTSWIRVLEIDHGRWVLAEDGKSWQSANPASVTAETVDSGAKDNAKAFHYRTKDHFSVVAMKPLYREMSFIDLDGPTSR